MKNMLGEILIFDQPNDIIRYRYLIFRLKSFKFEFLGALSNFVSDKIVEAQFDKYLLGIDFGKHDDEIVKFGLLGKPVISNSNYPNCVGYESIKEIITFINTYVTNNKEYEEIIKDSVQKFLEGIEPENIVVSIPSLKRHSILKLNVNLLKLQTMKCIVVCILDIDDQYDDIVGDNIYVVRRKEIKPLGMKRQIGLNYCRFFYPKKVMIHGSDDLLSLGWIEYISKEMEDYDQIGARNWLMYDETNKQMYKMEYENMGRMLGAGMMIDHKILNKINWCYFPYAAGATLDGSSTSKLQRNGGRSKVITCNLDTNFVLSYKGSWFVINKTSNCIKSRNIICSKITNFMTNLTLEDHEIIIANFISDFEKNNCQNIENEESICDDIDICK